MRHGIPASIWALGFVSMLMDISSEMIHALLPVYLVTVLGASFSAVGAIEGIAEATASITKVFSGVASDWLGRRKILAVVGYGLAALTKPVFPLASSLGWIVAARFLDRVGKGIRGAPRDALVADLAPPDLRGASFGLRQSLDTVGAFVGPLVAMALMWVTLDDFKTVFWVAVVPAFLAVGLLILAVKEPKPAPEKRPRRSLKLTELRLLGSAYWLVVATAAFFTLARFSEAFLILRGQSVGLPLPLVPIALVIMSLAYSLSAYPVGIISDRKGRASILLMGILLLVAADLVLSVSENQILFVIGVVLWGLHMGFTQGVFATLVADTAPASRRGTAFGTFNLVTGVTLFVSSLIAGLLWDAGGPKITFLAGAAFALSTAAMLLTLRRRLGLLIKV